MNGAFRLGIVSAAVLSGIRPSPPVPTVFGWGSSQGGTTTLSNSDRTIAAAASVGRVGVIGKASRASGKWYFESTHTSVAGAPNNRVGIATSAWVKSNVLGEGLTGAAVSFHGYAYRNGYTGSGVMASPVPSAAGAVTGFAIDLDAGKIWVAVNGSWKWSGNPAAGTSPAISGLLSNSYFPALTVELQSSAWTVTVSERVADLVYAPPSGFSPWVT